MKKYMICTKDLFMDNGEQRFTTGQKYKVTSERTHECTLINDQGRGHVLSNNGWMKFFIEDGPIYYLCSKDLRMEDGDIAFTKGKTYELICKMDQSDGENLVLKDNQWDDGNLTHSVGPRDWLKYFTIDTRPQYERNLQNHITG